MDLQSQIELELVTRSSGGSSLNEDIESFSALMNERCSMENAHNFFIFKILLSSIILLSVMHSFDSTSM